MKMKKAFTLMELLIVIALLVALAIIVLITLNPWGQLNKSRDSKRKTELTQLSKVFEDFYNDKQCYPRPQDVCYPSTESGYNPLSDTKCYLCGNASGSPQITSYLPHLPCDPQHPAKKYLYQADDIGCPSWYRIYTVISNQSDPAIAQVGCSAGCGPSPDFSYNYGVTSPNIGLEANNNLCSLASRIYTNPNCQICDGSYDFCKTNLPDKVFYTDPGVCEAACIKD